MKKEYHGFRIEKVDISSETIMVSSLGSCTLTYNYQDVSGAESMLYDFCVQNPNQDKPYPYNNMA